jgi:hypothetical protein
MLERAPVYEGISHVMPGIVNILLGGGDRYLTANMLVMKSIVSIGDGDAHYQDKSSLHIQAASFNAFHEDNYYQAAAALPWNGFVDEGQVVLKMTRETRKFDPWPAFFEGFNEFYFNKNYRQAADLSLIAANRSSGDDRRLFKDLAAKWLTSGANYKLALTIVTELEKNTRSPQTKEKLRKRIQRLENLILLENLVNQYNANLNRWPKNIYYLVAAKLIKVIPIDPWRKKYVLIDGNTKVGVEK